MARQVDRYTVIFSVERQKNGSYAPTPLRIEANISDPDGAKMADKIPLSFAKEVAFDGTKTLNQVRILIEGGLASDI